MLDHLPVDLFVRTLNRACTHHNRYRLAIERGYSKALILDPGNQYAQRELEKAQAAMKTQAAKAPLAAEAAADALQVIVAII